MLDLCFKQEGNMFDASLEKLRSLLGEILLYIVMSIRRKVAQGGSRLLH